MRAGVLRRMQAPCSSILRGVVHPLCCTKGDYHSARSLLLQYAKDDAAQPTPTKLAQSLLETMPPPSICDPSCIELVDVDSSSQHSGNSPETPRAAEKYINVVMDELQFQLRRMGQL
eukprot:RCo042072